MTAPDVSRAARRFADRQSERLAEVAPPPQFVATVTATSPLSVSWRGRVLPVAGRNAAYTPAVGHRVKCVLLSDQLLIDYRITI